MNVIRLIRRFQYFANDVDLNWIYQHNPEMHEGGDAWIRMW